MESLSRFIVKSLSRIKKSGKLLVAFFVIFGLLAAPIQMPLEELIIASITHTDREHSGSATKSEKSAAYTYTAPRKESEYTSTYTKGEMVPRISPEAVTETPPDVALGITPETTILDSVQKDTGTKLDHTPRSSSRAHANIRGAELVAQGENGSEVTQVVLDANANVLALVDAHGEKIEATYNNTEDPITITYPDDTTVTYSYDEDGNVTGITYGEKKNTNEEDDGVIETVARALIQPLFALAGIGEEQNTTNIEYDDSAVTEIKNGESSISYEYDEEGLLARETRTDGSYIEYSYDELGNIVEKVEIESDSEPSFSFTSFIKRTIANILPVSYTESVEYNDNNQLVRFQIERDAASYESATSTEPEESQVVPEVTPTDNTSSESSANSSTPAENVENSTNPEIPNGVLPEVSTEHIEQPTPEAEIKETQTNGEENSIVSWIGRVGAQIHDRITNLLSFTYADETNEVGSIPENAEVSVPPTQPETLPEENTYTPPAEALPTPTENSSTEGISEVTETHIPEVVPEATATPMIENTVTTEEPSTMLDVPPESIAPAFLDLAFSYDAQGNMLTRKSTTGFGITYSYDKETDARDGIVAYTSTGNVLERTYRIDNKTARIVGQDGVRFAYDKTGALTSAGTISYTYDDRGNRLSAAEGNGEIAYRYDANRLEIVSYPNGRITSYTYNERGQVTTIHDTEKGDTSLTYNETGAVVSLKNTTEQVTYAYDAVGRRTSRTSSLTGSLTYTYTGPQLTKVSGSNGEVLREYFYTPKGDLVALVMNDTLYHVITDHSKSIVGLVHDTTGTLLTQTYDAWGKITESTIGDMLDIGYVGAFTEPTFGFSVLGPRVYDPEIGRFLSKDPLPGFIIDTLSQNEYLYAKNDPINHFDPSGHQSELADTSTSPVRALVETKLLIESLESELAATKAVVRDMEALVQEDPGDQESVAQLEGARQSVTTIESALEVLRSMKKKQEEEIAANEAAAVVSFSLPAPTNADPSLSSPINLTIPVLEAVPVTTPTTPSEPEGADEDADDDESLSFAPGATLAFKNFVDDHLLKAEAKKKKSDKKKKKSKKSKKKSSNKAKEVQKKKAEQAAKMSALLTKLSKILSDLKVIVDKRVEEEKRLAQKPAPKPIDVAVDPLQNLVALNQNTTSNLQATPLTFGFTSPTNGDPYLTTAINMGTYNSTPTQTQSSGMQEIYTYARSLITVENGALVLSFVPVAGEVYDFSSVVLGEDPITHEKLSHLGKIVTVAGLLSGIGSGKGGRKAFDEALEKIARDNGLTLDEVRKIAEDVAGGVTLKNLSTNTYSDIITKVRKGVEEVKATKTLLVAGETIAGLRVTQHSAEQFAKRNITKEKIVIAMEKGRLYKDNVNNTLLHVVSDTNEKGYTIITDLENKVLVTVEDFIPNLYPERFIPQ